jgi:hypothetical protein
MQDRLLLSNQQEAAGRTLRMDGLPVILLASSRSEMVAASPSRLSSSFSRRDKFSLLHLSTAGHLAARDGQLDRFV